MGTIVGETVGLSKQNRFLVEEQRWGWEVVCSNSINTDRHS